jgi:hypothetical protein
MRIEFEDIKFDFKPAKYEDYKKHVGKITEIRDTDAVIVDNWEYERGGVLKFFLMTFDLLPEEKVKLFWKILEKQPRVSNPAYLYWDDGVKYPVVFAEIGDEKCKFEESIRDYQTGDRFFKGTVALVEIARYE